MKTLLIIIVLLFVGCSVKGGDGLEIHYQAWNEGMEDWVGPHNS
jgi:hypothetical protein